MHVMIVDDTASQRTLVRSLVKDISESIKVSDVADPVQALLLSQKDPPDMLIIDYRMPKMDGLEFVRRFRRPLSQRDIPVIFISVVDDASVREAALSAGVIDYIVKPIQPLDFKAKLKSLIEMRQHQVSQKNRSYLLEHQLNTALRDIEITSPGEAGKSYIERFNAAMDDDFNTPEAVAVLFDLANQVNKQRDVDAVQASALATTLKHLGAVLGVLQDNPAHYLQSIAAGAGLDNTPIETFIQQRLLAKQNKNWAEADRIRDELKAQGVILEDKGKETSWRRE